MAYNDLELRGALEVLWNAAKHTMDQHWYGNAPLRKDREDAHEILVDKWRILLKKFERA